MPQPSPPPCDRLTTSHPSCSGSARTTAALTCGRLAWWCTFCWWATRPSSAMTTPPSCGTSNPGPSNSTPRIGACNKRLIGGHLPLTFQAGTSLASFIPLPCPRVRFVTLSCAYMFHSCVCFSPRYLYTPIGICLSFAGTTSARTRRISWPKCSRSTPWPGPTLHLC